MARDHSRPSEAPHLDRSSAARRAGQVLYWSGIALLVFVMVLPFLWMVATSLMDEFAVFAYPPPLLPRPARLSNYLNAWRALPFGRFYLNSLLFSLAVVVGQVTTSALAAYAFARLRFPGRDRLFGLMLLTFMIPGVITLVPRFVLLKELGWINTYAGLIVPELSSIFSTFLLREHFRSLPQDVFDAARIDGAGHFRQMLQIALPMSIPIATTLLLLGAVAHWNAYLWPLIVTNTQDMRTLPIGLQALKYKTGEIPQWNVVMAGATMVLLPLIAIFLAAQKKFVEGAVQGALKG